MTRKRQEPREVEVEAKTAQEAIRIALARLRAERSEVDIKVLTEERKGLFSMQGSQLAKVKVIKKLQK